MYRPTSAAQSAQAAAQRIATAMKRDVQKRDSQRIATAMKRDVQKRAIGKPLSKGMQQWVEANRSKLKKPTDRQKAIFAKYDKMKEAGMLTAKPAKQSNKTTAGQPSTTTKSTAPAPVQPRSGSKPKSETPTTTPSNTRRDRQRGSTGGRGGSVSSKSKSGTYGSPLPSNPKLKSQNTSRLTGRQKINLEVAEAAKSSRNKFSKPKNPKKGQIWTTRFGLKMKWTGTNWKQVSKSTE